MPNNHITQAYDNDLLEINKKILQMGHMVIEAVDNALLSLINQDNELAAKVRAADIHIDSLQHEIEEKCTLTIAKRQPVANDLRAVISALRVANDLERVGDLAKNIAKRVMKINAEAQSPPVPLSFKTMGDMVCERLERVLIASEEKECDDAYDVWARDGEVDACYNSLFRELLTYMAEKPQNITACAHLLFCAKNLERVGDHATNIAEVVWYREKGEMLANVRPKG